MNRIFKFFFFPFLFLIISLKVYSISYYTEQITSTQMEYLIKEKKKGNFVTGVYLAGLAEKFYARSKYFESPNEEYEKYFKETNNAYYLFCSVISIALVLDGIFYGKKFELDYDSGFKLNPSRSIMNKDAKIFLGILLALYHSGEYNRERNFTTVKEQELTKQGDLICFISALTFLVDGLRSKDIKDVFTKVSTGYDDIYLKTGKNFAGLFFTRYF